MYTARKVVFYPAKFCRIEDTGKIMPFIQHIFAEYTFLRILKNILQNVQILYMLKKCHEITSVSWYFEASSIKVVVNFQN